MRRLIRTDGSHIDFVNPLPMQKIAELIGAQTLDSVVLHHLGLPVQVLICDDNGWDTEPVEHDGYTELRPMRPRKPINEQASALYLLNCKAGTTHKIAGDVFVTYDSDFAL